MRVLFLILRILAFILLSTLNFEYLFNRQSNTLLSVLCILIEALLFFVLLRPLFKQLLK